MALGIARAVAVAVAVVLAERAGAVHPDDVPALTALHGAFGEQLGWDASPGVDPCLSWFRISCAASTRVQGIDLNNAGVEGSLPAELATLTALESLKFWNNPGITGPLPPALSDIKTLRFVEGFGCSIGGPMPALVDMPALVMVWLSRNRITGPLVLSGLPALTRLQLDGNQLTGTIPRDLFSQAPQLSIVWLSRNRLTGPLTELDAAGDGSLTEFYSADNAHGGAFPAALVGAMPALERIDLRAAALTGTLSPAMHAPGRDLLQLRLSDNPGMWGTVPPEIASPSLEIFEVANCSFSGAVPALPNRGPEASFRVECNSFSEGLADVLGLAAGARCGSCAVGAPLQFAQCECARPCTEDDFLASVEGVRAERDDEGRVVALAGSGVVGTLGTLDLLPVLANLTLVASPGLQGTVPPGLFQNHHDTDPRTRGVAHITLDGTSLSGSFPTEMGDDVQSVRVRNAPALSGPAPEAGASLELLSLAGTPVTGAIPASWQDVDAVDIRGTAMRDSALPAFLVAEDILEPLAGNSDVECRRISHFDRDKAWTVDQAYLEFALCACREGLTGSPPDGCQACPADSFYDAEALACSPCPPNSVSVGAATVALGRGVCRCNAGFAQATNDAVDDDEYCRPCGAGTFSTAGSEVCLTCADGTISYAEADACFQCPERGVQCRGGSGSLLDGYWHDNSVMLGPETRFYECSPSRLCAIDEADPQQPVVCADGHEGILCASCQDGYGASFLGNCARCWPAGAAGVYLAAIVIGVSALIAGLVRETLRAEEGSTRSTLMRVLITHLQGLVMVSGFALGGPQGAGNAIKASAILGGVDVDLNFNPFSCSTGFSYYERVAVVLLLPPVLCIVASTAALVASRTLASLRGIAPSTVVVSAISVALFQTYTATSRSLIEFYPCRTVLGHRFHEADLAARCDGGSHGAMVSLVSLGLVLYVAGIPALAMAALAKNRTRLDDKKVRQRIGFLYAGYRVELAGWEVVVLARKLLLLAASVGLSTDPGLQSFAGVLIFCVALALQVLWQPFRDARVARVEVASLVASGLTVAAWSNAGVASDGSHPRATVGIAVAAVLVVQLVFLWEFVRCLAQSTAAAPLGFLRRRLSSLAGGSSVEMSEDGRGL